MNAQLVLLTFLYFIQGLPYGFQAKFLPIYLHSRGTSLTQVLAKDSWRLLSYVTSWDKISHVAVFSYGVKYTSF